MVTISCHKSYESDSYGSDTQDTSKQQRGGPVRGKNWMQSNFCRATNHGDWLPHCCVTVLPSPVCQSQ